VAALRVGTLLRRHPLDATDALRVLAARAEERGELYDHRRRWHVQRGVALDREKC
jgi:hypothetical protein